MQVHQNAGLGVLRRDHITVFPSFNVGLLAKGSVYLIGVHSIQLSTTGQCTSERRPRHCSGHQFRQCHRASQREECLCFYNRERPLDSIGGQLKRLSFPTNMSRNYFNVPTLIEATLVSKICRGTVRPANREGANAKCSCKNIF